MWRLRTSSNSPKRWRYPRRTCLSIYPDRLAWKFSTQVITSWASSLKARRPRRIGELTANDFQAVPPQAEANQVRRLLAARGIRLNERIGLLTGQSVPILWCVEYGAFRCRRRHVLAKKAIRSATEIPACLLRLLPPLWIPRLSRLPELERVAPMTSRPRECCFAFNENKSHRHGR